MLLVGLLFSYCVNRRLMQIFSNCERFSSPTSSSTLKYELLLTRTWLRQSVIEQLKYLNIRHLQCCLQCCLHCRSEVRNAGAKVALVKAAEEL
jgi:hypothetical protein